MGVKNESQFPRFTRILPIVLESKCLSALDIVALFSTTSYLWDYFCDEQDVLRLDLSTESAVQVEWLMNTFKQGSEQMPRMQRKPSRLLPQISSALPPQFEPNAIGSLFSCLVSSGKQQLRSFRRPRSGVLRKRSISSSSSTSSVGMSPEVQLAVRSKQKTKEIRRRMDSFRQLGAVGRVVGIHLKGVEVDVEEEGAHDLYQLFENHIAACNLVSVRLSHSPAISNLHQFSACLNLKVLDCRGCPNLVNLGGIGNCVQLEHLNLAGCGELTNIATLSGLSNLKVLVLDSCKKLISIQSVSMCLQLEELSANFMECLSSVGAAIRCKKLWNLSMSGFEDFISLPYFKSLKVLNLSFSDDLKDLEVLAGSHGLEDLNLSYCEDLESIDLLRQHVNLQQLNISRCRLVTDLSCLTDMKTLFQLNCAYSDQLKYGTLNCVSLVKLNVSNCPQLQSASDISCLAQCVSLSHLDLADCENLKSISVLKHCKKLTWVSLSGCQIQSLKPLSHCPNLKVLDVSCCDRIEKVGCLSKCPLLTNLNLAGCIQIRDVRKLHKLSHLQVLNMSECIGLPPVLPGFSNLVEIDLSFCDQLMNVSSLRQSTQLRMLKMRGCQAENLADAIESCDNLRYIDLTSFGDKYLKSVLFVSKFKCLEFASFSNCSAKDKMLTVGKLLQIGCKVEY